MSLPPRTPYDYHWLYERAEDSAAAGLPLEEALQAVRDGYSSIAADRAFAEEEGAPEVFAPNTWRIIGDRIDVPEL